MILFGQDFGKAGADALAGFETEEALEGVKDAAGFFVVQVTVVIESFEFRGGGGLGADITVFLKSQGLTGEAGQRVDQPGELLWFRLGIFAGGG